MNYPLNELATTICIVHAGFSSLRASVARKKIGVT